MITPEDLRYCLELAKIDVRPTEHHLPRRLRNRPVEPKPEPKTLADWARAAGYIRRHRHNRKRWPKSIIELLSEAMPILYEVCWRDGEAMRKTLPEGFTA